MQRNNICMCVSRRPIAYVIVKSDRMTVLNEMQNRKMIRKKKNTFDLFKIYFFLSLSSSTFITFLYIFFFSSNQPI